jgi:hypothetical protein
MEALQTERGHLLLTKELKEKFPGLRETDGVADAMVIAKFFSPYSGWTWYAFEFDGEDTFFGLVKGFETEWGYFSYGELAGVTLGAMNLPAVERDCYFTPITREELVTKLEAGEHV